MSFLVLLFFSIMGRLRSHKQPALYLLIEKQSRWIMKWRVRSSLRG